jgi:hypothetical protein
MYADDIEGGHYFAYNQALQRGVEHNGWQFRAWTNASKRLSTLPDGWSYSLGHRTTRSGPFRRILSFFDLVATQRKRLVELLRTTDSPIVLFSEWFQEFHLASLVLTLLTCRLQKRVQLWVHFHFPFHRGGRMQKLLLEIAENRLGKSAVQRFSINTILTKQLSHFFRRPVHLLPMPLLDDWSAMENHRQLNDNKITLLWPGRSRIDKGRSVMQTLTGMRTPLAANFIFVVGNAKFMPTTGSAQIQSMGTQLPRRKYLRWFESADAVILPYGSAEYKEICSSVFIEAVCAGIFPLVSSDTWMARELQEAGLSECIIDWQAPDVHEIIREVIRNADVTQKLTEMTKRYRIRHSTQNVGSVLDNIYSSCAQSTVVTNSAHKMR